MESTNKNKRKIIVPIVLGTGLVISLGFNIWLYSQLSSMNMTGMQTELSTIQTKYEALSQKIEQGKQSLIAMQEENSQLKQEGLQAQVEVIQEKPAASPSTSEKASSKAGTVKQAPSQSSSNSGRSQLPPEEDKNGNGIVDFLEGDIAGEGTTTSDPNFNLGTNP